MKKGQISFEFILTYGWVFIVALIVISGLLYFGVFNPNNLTPDRCIIAPVEFFCSETVANAQTTYAFSAIVTSGLQDVTFDVSSMSARVEKSACQNILFGAGESTINGADATDADITVKSDAQILINLVCDVAPLNTEKPVVYFSIDYAPIGKEFEKNMTIQLDVSVQ